jgi:N-acetylglucosaminyldiphosphoundecaprenol N-acetyl-beta-D-mannosaminyltransferase
MQAAKPDALPKRDGAAAALPAIATDFHREVYCLSGIAFDVATMEDTVQKIVGSVKSRKRCNLTTPNANFLRLARQDPAFRRAIMVSDLCVMDGLPLVWLGRAVGIKVPERVAGSDIFDALRRTKGTPLRTYFFGADEATGERAREKLSAEAGGIECVGTDAPGFGSLSEMERDSVFTKISQSNPDIVSVSIGAQKSIPWIARNEKRLSASVVCNLGATINFVAGTVARAPASYRKYGLEWLWRVRQEPQLWRRYVLDFATLFRVFGGEVVPAMVAARLGRPTTAMLNAAKVVVMAGTTGRVVKFSGAFTEQNLQQARESLMAATAVPGALTLDIDDVTFMDPAFAGLLLLACGHQLRAQLPYVVKASTRGPRAALRRHGCGFLLADSDARANPAARPLPAPAPGQRAVGGSIPVRNVAGH